MMVARGIMLGAQQMNRGVGKILDPARVIEIQMYQHDVAHVGGMEPERLELAQRRFLLAQLRSEEHTSELQSLMRISYAVFCLKKKIINITQYTTITRRY